MTSTSVGAQVLAFIEADALTSFGTPLLTFLTAVQAAQGDPIKQGAAFVQLQGNLVAASPTALAGLENQLAQVLATKIQALQAAAAKAA